MQAGPPFVAQVTSKGGFRRRDWRETSLVPLHYGYAGPRLRPPWTVPLKASTQNVPFRFEPYVNLAIAVPPEE